MGLLLFSESPRYTGGSQGNAADLGVVRPTGSTGSSGRGIEPGSSGSSGETVNVSPPARVIESPPAINTNPRNPAIAQEPSVFPAGMINHSNPLVLSAEASDMTSEPSSLSIGMPTTIWVSDLDPEQMEEFEREWKKLDQEAQEREQRRGANGGRTLREIVDDIIHKLHDPNASLSL
ncbi:MAG: hypothetical protein R3A11_04780 [Bdellovibrionota bacterium]